MGVGLRGAAQSNDEHKLLRSTGVIEDSSPAPIPIPGGLNAAALLGPRAPNRLLHVFLPVAGMEPLTIFHFIGRAGIFNIHGTGTRTLLDPITGLPTAAFTGLPYSVDVRFFDGVYKGVDGRKHQGTFAFYSLDVFQVGHTFGEFDFQLHGHNPGVSETGLFWTTPVPPDSVGMSDGGEAVFSLSDRQMPDTHDLLTALWGGGEKDGLGMPLSPVFPSSVSVEARWFNPGRTERLRDAANRFEFVHRKTDAHIKWKSTRRGAKFESDNSSQRVFFAALGWERNGDFLNKDDP